MEKNKKDMDDVLGKDIKDKAKKVFDKFLKENKLNRMSVGGGRVADEEFVFYQPHNFRAYVSFDKGGFSVVPKVDSDVTRSVVTTERNYGHEKVFSGFMGCQIAVKKTQIEIRNFVEHKRWFRVFMGRHEEEIIEIISKKICECLDVLREFVRCYGGSSDYKVLNVYSEDKVTAEDSIDRLPLKMRFRNEVLKKVYRERNVEFSSSAEASQFLTSRVDEKFVLNEIKDVKLGFEDALSHLQKDALLPLTEQIQLHLEVQRETLGTLKAIRGEFMKPTLEDIKQKIGVLGDVLLLKGDIERLSVSDRLLLSDWLFVRFGE